MDPITEAELRASFVNCTRGERSRIALPGRLDAVDFDRLDFLGWRDPKAPDRACLVTRAGDRWVGLVLRAATKTAKSLTKSTMCSLCMTLHASSGVTLFAAPLTGAAGRNGNSVGTYICTDLQCSLYVRGLLKSDAITRMNETIAQADRIERLRLHVEAFVENVVAAGAAAR
ncbi:FBP domain-containing protein [Plantactinospora sp. GCM10030261]|uniref:FBP domain-containing protein n=1 Tax=Plantactinospora sp. GCM10030261 TaxID=3273420 RepID=UPI0036096C41